MCVSLDEIVLEDKDVDVVLTILLEDVVLSAVVVENVDVVENNEEGDVECDGKDDVSFVLNILTEDVVIKVVTDEYTDNEENMVENNGAEDAIAVVVTSLLEDIVIDDEETVVESDGEGDGEGDEVDVLTRLLKDVVLTILLVLNVM